jgi:hypothetical protein
VVKPGIYFGLDESEYHKDAALGSTDIRRLLTTPCDWWWHSDLNPARPSVEPTPAMMFGRAVHACLLEGEETFRRQYGCCEHPGNIKAGKAERAAFEEAGKVPLKGDDYRRILIASATIKANPHLAEAFNGGLPEVSVFWERDGVPMKCRIDYFKSRASVDLKSIRNARSIDFREACRRRFSDDRHDMQAAHYVEGRQQMLTLLTDGLVYGDHDDAWLAKAAAGAAAFVFVYWQAEDAPVTWSRQLSPGNPVLEYARNDIERALANYRQYREQFGTDRAWILAEPIEELDMSELPPWHARAA